MDKALEMQKMIKIKSEELVQHTKGLYEWEKEMKQAELTKKEKKIIENLPPPRSNVEDLEKFAAEEQFKEGILNEIGSLEQTLAKVEADKLKDRGNKSNKLGDYNNAVEFYTQAIDLYDKDPVYYCNRSSCYLNLEKFEECISDCNQAIDLDRNYSQAYHQRMLAYETLGKNEIALHDAETVLKLSTNAKEVNDAKKNYERIKKRIPKSALIGLIDISNKENREMPNAISPRVEADRHKEAGNKFIAAKEYKRALECYTNAIGLVEDEPIYYSNRGHCYLNLNEYENCLKDCSRAIELNHSFFRPYYRRMQAYEKLGNYEAALSDCEKVMELATQEKQKLSAVKDYERIKQRLKIPQLHLEKDKLQNIWEDLKRSSKLIDFVQKAPHTRSKKPMKNIKILEVGNKSPEKFAPFIQSDEPIPDSVVDRIFNNNTGECTDEPEYRRTEDNNLEYLFPSTSSNLKNFYTPQSTKIKTEPVKIEKVEKEEKEKVNTEILKPTPVTEIGKVDKEKINAENFQKEHPAEEKLATNVSFPIPKTSTEFFKAWMTLDTPARYLYLKNVAETPFNQLMGANLSSEIVTEILSILDQYFIRDNVSVVNILKEMGKNDQMNILPLLFDHADKAAIKNLVEYMEKRDDCHSHRKDIDFIKIIYGL